MIIDKKRFAIAAASAQNLSEAKALAKELNLTFVSDALSEEAQHYDYVILLHPHYLGLHKTSEKKLHPFYIDFTVGKLRYRSQKASLRNELLARAVGEKPKDEPSIIDATAGLGKDSFILASLGFKITMLERSPILFLLLKDGLKRAKANPETADAANNLTLVFAEATDWLKNLSYYPHVIYLDPMFPERKKSASVKKDMIILQDLLGKSRDARFLFEQALACARKRVVVKRPRSAAYISTVSPHFSYLGKSSRFDVYLAFNHAK